jgi:hypothetical protein
MIPQERNERVLRGSMRDKVNNNILLPKTFISFYPKSLSYDFLIFMTFGLISKW